MKHNKRGFTLIELLVVVLIIGILSAIALPKYQRSVNKSRFATLKPMASAFADAQEAVYLANDSYTTDKDDLSVSAPPNTDMTVELSQNSIQNYVRTSYDNLNNRYLQYLKHSPNFAGNIYCEALATDTSAQELCLNEGGTDAQITRDGYKWYLLEGDSTGEFFTTVSLVYTGPSYYPQVAYTAVYSDGETTVKVVKGSGGTVWTVTVGGTTTTYHDDGYVASLVNSGYHGQSLKTKSEMCQQYPFIEGC